MAWSKEYKKSINCSDPKGFSQKAHCDGRKARQRGEKTMSKSVNEQRLNEIQLFLEENCPTDPSKWSYYKGQAKKKFDVYPSAYANAWAAKQYKGAGGGWKTCSKKESIEEATLSQIHAAAKKGSYPVTVVAVDLGRVIDQELVKTPMAVPAAFMMMQGAYPKAKIHVEDKTGKILFKESVNEEQINEANFKGKNWFFTTFSDGDIRGDISVSKTATWKLTNAGNSLGIGGQFTLMDAGKVRARAAFPKAGNLAQLAKRMYDTAQKETTYGVDKNIKETDILDGLRGYYKAWASTSNESVNENTVIGDVRKKLGSPPKGTDVRDRSGQIYVYFHSKDSKSKKYAERVKELVRNDYRKTAILLDLDKKNESINEAKEPEVISQLRSIVKDQQNKKIKDPVSGKMMRVDLYSASAVTQVYDAINKANKEKFEKLSLPKMVNIAFKIIK